MAIAHIRMAMCLPDAPWPLKRGKAVVSERLRRAEPESIHHHPSSNKDFVIDTYGGLVVREHIIARTVVARGLA